jgi:hypothetical protein
VPEFRPGAALSRDFYWEVLAPALGAIPRAAGLLGPGSDVLGYDTARSTDHDWGPRATILVDPEDVEDAATRVAAALPERFGGWPTSIGRDGRPPEPNVPVRTVGRFSEEQLGVDATGGLGTLDWLAISQQHLLQVTAGPVFHDDQGRLTALRDKVAWYPDQIWWWLLACQWMRVEQEEPFLPRAAEVGDELGAAVIAARLTRDCIRLALLMARRYAPYSKWLGSAFTRLPDPDGLTGHLAAAMEGLTQSREAGLAGAYETLARRHALLPGAAALDPRTHPFWDRPARIIGGDRFAADCLRHVNDPQLRRLPLVGGVDQLADTTDLLSDQTQTRRLRQFYEEGEGRLEGGA